MRTLLGITFMLLAAQTQATDIPSKVLSNLVAEADHVLVGTVTKVDMVDGHGKVVSDKGARTGPGSPNQLRLHVAVDTNRILATTAKLPSVIVVPLWRKWHDTLGNRQQETQGKTSIFLLKGLDFQPVYPGLFMRELSDRGEIETLLKQKCVAAEAPALGVNCQRVEDKIMVANEGDRMVLTVTSPGGIGKTVITRQGATWPSAMTLRLRLAGLESLAIRNDTLTLKASVQSHGEYARRIQLLRGADPAETLDPGLLRAFAADGKPTDKLPGKDGWFELAVPGSLFGADVKELKMDWIDFFR